jgi:hypothetical protein
MVLPAVNGTTARMGFAGQVCAQASRARLGAASAAPARRKA